MHKSAMVNPIASGAKGAVFSLPVTCKMIVTKKNVRTASARNTECWLYPPGEYSPKPVDAKPFVTSKLALPVQIS